MTWRCQGWDYCQPCIYQITIVLADRRSKALGRLLVADGHGNWVEPAVAKSLGLKLQKPSGRYFDACSDGRLLMLAPAAWPYSPGEKAMTRFDATAVNRLCQAIAGDGAAVINYHGMKPSNVDALAREAAKIETRGVR